jgi:threonine/homoserine/homoserine lactone efflux protein
MVVRPERGGLLVQFTALGLVLATMGVMGDSLVAVIAARTGRRMAAGSGESASREAVLVALGVRLAFVRR